ncbi:TPA: hypothetical protein JD758_002383 [Legionella pneumophila]|nr:hypothetical protein [Legionella pneumophila]HCC3170262.1 hypothetical protein [Legionella pneumophila]HCC3188604.1 hypothetical protein [Legionella pneumophila]HCC3191788.1 hypothetical protein [Legionella pneumophila]HCC3194648.1 hypothetical protein [Legionella pneumophila]
MKKYLIVFMMGITELSIAAIGKIDVDQKTTFLGITPSLSITDYLSHTQAYSISVEGGSNNARINGTIGWLIKDTTFFKLSAEYLTQHLTYTFFSGSTKEWVSQIAIGANYTHRWLDYYLEPQFDLITYYSHAPSKNFTSIRKTVFPHVNSILSLKRIAGSNAFGVAPTINLKPFKNLKMGAALNWDTVNYDKQYSNPDPVNGFGATFDTDALITKNISLGGLVSCREAFNGYQANITLINNPFFPNWRLGLIGEYVQGKNYLPNSYNFIIRASYFADYASSNTDSRMLDKDGLLEPILINDGFIEWTSKSAAHLPQVLAVADEIVLPVKIQDTPSSPNPTHPTPECTAPALIRQFPAEFTTSIFQNLDTYFTGSNLVYTIHFNSQIDNGSLRIENQVLIGQPSNYPFIQPGVQGYLEITITAVSYSSDGQVSCGAITSNAFDAFRTF